METFFGVGLFLGFMIFIPVSLVSAAIILLLAKYVGKIENAKYLNSWLVVIVASILSGTLSSLVGYNMWMTLKLEGVIFLSFILSSICFISVGKFIWKCE